MRKPKQWWDAAPLAPETAEPVQKDKWWEAAPVAEEPTAYEQYVAPALQGVSDAASSVYTTVVGKQDPKFKDLPSIESASGILDPVAEMVGLSDAAYHDIYKKSLGDRYIGTERDANGYPIITFKGKDGKPRKAYVNRPGLDGMDVNRAISGSLPYMAAASIAGRAVAPVTAGGGALANLFAAGTQGVTAAATSVGQDLTAQGIGSKQGIDQTRALFAGGLGAGGELVGRAFGPFIRKFFGDRSLVTAEGKLTPRGIALAKKQGVDPKLIDDELAKEFQRRAMNAMDPAEALTKSQTDRFGIPTTKGQRTNDPQMLLIEKDIRAGTLGDRAKQALKNLDDNQKSAIEAAARGDEFPFPNSSNVGTPKTIAPKLAPGRGAADQGKDVLGAGAKQGLDAAKQRMRQLEAEAWKGTENISPRAGAAENLPDFIRKALGARRVKPGLTPTALEMGEELKAFMNGKALQTGTDDIFQQQSVTYIDEMRRVLMAYKNGAQPGADSGAANAIYRAFDDWMVDAAEKNLLTGSPGAAQKILNARRLTAELRGILKPLEGGKKTAAARILDKVGDAQNGEEVLTALLGASGPKGSMPQGAVSAIIRFKAATTKLGGEVGKQAWDDVRLAYWLKLVTGKDGEMLPNGTLITSIKDTFNNRPSLMNALYSKSEQKLMRQFAQAIKSATPKDPNPPGSGTAIRGLFPNLVKDQLKAEQARNTFGAKGQRHKILMARIYRGLSKVVPQVLDAKNQFGGMAASRATSQTVTPKAPPSLAGYATAFSPSATSDRVPLFAAPKLRQR